MYFTDITNPELQSYSTDIVDTFSISLTRALTSKLFKVETIISNKLYKIYPLFYCDRIESSNPDDKVLSNRLVICSKDNSTFLKFIREGDDVNRSASNFEHYYKTIADTLSDAEFNGYIQLLRIHDISEAIEIDNLNSEYGDYQFDIDATVLDNGILVTEDTSLNVTLNNPLFPNSTYTLKLKALNISDVNLIDRGVSHLTYKNITVDLIKNEPVTIPLTNLDIEDVILFDAEVVVDHTQPVIILPDVIELTASGNMFVSEPVSLSARYTHGSLPVQSETISFYDGDTLLGTGDTDEDGVATYTFTPSHVGRCDFRAVLDNTVSNIVSRDITLVRTNISISGKSYAYVDDLVTIDGVLVDYEDTPLGMMVVKVLDNGTELLNMETDSDGEYTHSIDTSVAKSFNLYGYFPGTNIYAECTSNVLLVKVLKRDVRFNNVSSIRAVSSNTFTVTGNVTELDGTVVANEVLGYSYKGASGTVTTNANGEFSFDAHISEGSGAERISVGTLQDSRKYQKVSVDVVVRSKFESHFVNVSRSRLDNQYVYSARLTTLGGRPLVGKNVTATIGTESQDNVTNDDGLVVWVQSTSKSFALTFLEDDEAIGCTGGL